MVEIDSHRINYQSSLIGQYQFHFYFNMANYKHSSHTCAQNYFLQASYKFITE